MAACETGPDADPLYDRLKNALDILGTSGARAILWHQGESDSAANTSTEQYAARLSEIVAQSRKDAGYDIPWLVAHVSFLPSTSKRSEDRIVAGQEQVIESDPLIFAGPLTDDLVGSDWRWDQVHFNEAGLRLHAQRWADAVHSIVVPEPSTGLLIALGLVSLLPFLRREVGGSDLG